MPDAALFENLDELRFHFNRSGEDIGDYDDYLAAALMRHLDEETFHSVHGTSMYLHSLPFGDVDFFGTHIGDLFITLVVHQEEVGHLLVAHSEVADNAVLTFAGHEMQVVVYVFLEVDNIFLTGMEEYETGDDWHHLYTFLSMTDADYRLFGNEVFYLAIIGEHLFCSRFVLI